jgi:predicted transcriptional regulator YheO
MQTDDPYLRGLAAWAAGALRNKKTEVILNQLKDDSAKLDVYLDGHINGLSVGEISKKALQMVKNE